MPMRPRTRWARVSSWVSRSEPLAEVTAHPEQMLHASVVVLAGRAALIRGASGTGKSGLALQLIALGAVLVTDDRARVWREQNRLLADAPDTIRGRIEARGTGILHLPAAGPSPVACVIDMDRNADMRLPPLARTRVMGLALPVFAKTTHTHFPAAILLYLRHGKVS